MIFTRRFRRLHLKVTIPVAEKRHLFSPLQYIISFIFKPNPLFHITTGPVCRNFETLSLLIGSTRTNKSHVKRYLRVACNLSVNLSSGFANLFTLSVSRTYYYEFLHDPRYFS